MILGDDDILDENVVADFYKNLPQITQRGINVIKFSTAIIKSRIIRLPGTRTI